MSARRSQRTSALLVSAMVLSVVAVAALAYWDEQREAESVFEDFAEHQAATASMIGQHLRQRLLHVRRDARLAAEASAKGERPPASVADAYAMIAVRPNVGSDSVEIRPGRPLSLSVPVSEKQKVDLEISLGDLLGIQTDRPNRAILLVAPPGEAELHAADGRSVSFPELDQALEEGRAWVRIARDRAGRLGLPERTAVAGLSRVDAGPLGRWRIATVASAERERDREYHARARLLLAVVAAAGLAFSFGGIALAKQRKELELKLELEVKDLQRQRDERLKSLDKAVTLGTMAIGIAHEVSTPLGVISGRAEQILSKANNDERLTRSMRSILEQTQRISDVMRAFLGVARGEPPPIRSIAPRSIIENARSLVEHRFAEAEVALSFEVSAALPEVQGDPILLEQAVVNLMLNACEACDKGGHVEVTARNGGAAITFAVLDDGSGISTEEAARVREPFFTTKASRGGSGLGLAIVSEIVKHHGGKLVLASRAPRGTSAEMEIPVSRGESRGSA